ncbi:MAG: pyridoxal phosphate-dependent aminotransferase [Chloroflexota bacterium]|nr:pyridoxal phosphate-dependent aminotransferase [Chloroflexota bacterium]
MSISRNVRDAMERGSWIRRMFEEGIALRKQYGEQGVFDLTLGNPVVEPPKTFKEELRKWADSTVSGLHRYMPNAGYPETRAAVAEALSSETGLAVEAEHIVMTVGAAGGLNIVLKAILNAGDEVIIWAPYFVEYLFYVDNHGGVSSVAQTDEHFLPTIAALEGALTPRTRAVIVNSPNNPTGVLYSSELLTEMAAMLADKEAEFGTTIYLISDEPYRKLTYDGAVCPFVFHHYPRSIVVNSHSKDLALPGERIGYVAVSPRLEKARELVDALVFCNRTLGFVNAPALMQHIVASLQRASVDVADYQRKRDYLHRSLTDMGYSVVLPQGAFYMFPRSPVSDEMDFIGELRKHNVLAVPGRGFGRNGFIRISFCTDDRTIEGALPGFRKVAQHYGLLS